MSARATETHRVYVPHTVWLASGLGVAAGRYDADLVGDGRALVPVRRYIVPSDMQHRPNWAYPMGRRGETARIYLQPGQFELDGEAPEEEERTCSAAQVKAWFPNSPAV